MNATYWMISAAITVAGICLMGAGAAEMRSQARAAASKQNETVTEHFSSIQGLSLDIGSTDLTIVPDDAAEDITVEVVNPPENLVLKDAGGVLILEEDTGFSLVNFGSPEELNRSTCTTVTVPAGTQFDDVYLHVGSGDVKELRGLSAVMLSVELGSGNAMLSELTVDDGCTLHTGSGNLSIEKSKIGGNVDLDTGSGSLSMSSCSMEELVTGAGSGDLKLNDVTVREGMTSIFGSGSLKGDGLTVGSSACWSFGSGDADVKAFQPGTLLELDLGSGDVRMELTGSEAEYCIDSSDFAGAVFIGGKKMKELTEVSTAAERQILVHGGSGDVKIDFAQ